MKIRMKWAALALAACLPLTASAHKTFLLPSATVLSDGDEAWITVDAAVTNDLFYFNHRPLALDNLAITAPDGSKVAPENANKGKWRSTFDTHLTQPGTYTLAIVSDGLNASYEDAKGEKKRVRGTAESLARDIPAAAKNIEITQYQNTVETFVTLGKPSVDTLKASGSGLELVPVTHPNDLFAGEAATFRFVLDGKPASGLKVSAIPGGTRYRDAQDEISVTTDANGEFSITWPAAGMYWLNASIEGGKPSVAKATSRRAGYTATLEVLQQ
jgi:uncharacterized GH25 family protein